MARAPFQVLVIPFRRGADGVPEYAVFRRSDAGYWQPVAGGGEDDEDPADAARREAHEEAGIPLDAPLYPLDSVTSVPVTCFADSHLWPDHPYVIPEHAFAVDATDVELRLSDEHSECRWVPYTEAKDLLHWESNRTALWELDERLGNDNLEPE
ncbi:MAG: NUDIX pyrophosphatase [bacterium]|nr:NUDIX pyrophosphatase [bacterium]